MCGISVLLRRGASATSVKDLCNCLQRRGPSAFNEITLSEPALRFMAAVLHLRGDQTYSQPVESKTSILLWNGEVFNGIDIQSSQADTEAVAVMLDDAFDKAVPTCEALTETMEAVEGPFAFIYFHKSSKRLFIARDRIGRRSVCYQCSQDGSFIFSSTCAPGMMGCSTETKENEECTTWKELPPFGVYSYDFSRDEDGEAGDAPFVIPKTAEIGIEEHVFLKEQGWTFSPWTVYNEPIAREAVAAAEVKEESKDEASGTVMLTWTDVELLPQALKLTRALAGAVARRICTLPHYYDKTAEASSFPIALLFSGGLDCTVIAALAHFFLPPSTPIDLLNVSFDTKTLSPDRRSALDSFWDLCVAYPSRNWRLFCIDMDYEEALTNKDHILALLQPQNSHMDFNIGCALWYAARGEGRVIEASAVHALLTKEACSESPPIDPLFEATIRGVPTLPVRNSEAKSWQPPVPFPAVEIPAENPKQKKLKSSVWERCPRSTEAVRSMAAVLLLGTGADEQLGGYGRHRTAAVKGGGERLREELQKDVRRLWQRNLGRDDRCLSDHGKEPRFPYLDEEVMACIAAMELKQIADFSLPRGEGDKRILRIVARMLRLFSCSTLAKRAIQFGSRISKASDKATGKSSRKVSGAAKFEL